MNTYGSGLGMAALVGLLIGVLLFVVVSVLAFLSWKWSRPGASFFKLAFPVVLPIFAIVLCLIFSSPHMRPWPVIFWIGVWTVAAAGFWGRAIWLRPGEDGDRLSVRRRQREIFTSLAVVGLLYSVWTGLTLAEAVRYRRWSAASYAQHVENQARQTEEWNAGRIATSAGAIAYSRDGRWLAVAARDDDGTRPALEVWDLTTGERTQRFPLNSRKDVTQLQFNASGTHLALAVGHEIAIYDLIEEQDPLTLLAGTELSWDAHNHLCFLDGENAIVVLQPGKVHVFQLTTGDSLPVLLPALQQSDLQAFAISPDQQWHATWSPSRKEIAAWRAGESQPAWTAAGIEASRALDLQFSSKGVWLAVSTREGEIVVWNTATGAVQQRWKPAKSLSNFRFSADGRQVVAVTREREELRGFIWDIATGGLVVQHALPVVTIGGVVLDAHGSELAADVFPPTREQQFFLKRTLQRFDTTTGQEHRGFAARK